MADYVCEECREEIEPEASTCPHCNYAPAEDLWESSKQRFSFGLLCIVFVITSPAALYLWPSSFLRWRASKSARPAVEV